MSVSDYQRQIEQTGAFDISYSASNIHEAKNVLNKLTQIQRELRQIKSNISLEIKRINSEYQNKMRSNTESVFSLGALVFGKKKLAGQFRADKKQSLVNEKNNVLKPYENLKLNIDSYLIAIEEGKNQVKEYILVQKQSS